MANDPVQSLKDQFGDVVQDVIEFRGETTVVVSPDRIVDVCRFLRDTPGLEYNFLSDIAGIDYQPQEPRFALNYHLLSMRYTRRLRLKVYWNDGDAPVPSINEIWRLANWEEREAYDMFGIPFRNHPDLRRILNSPDWEGYPQRKDYPLGYEAIQFSFNYDDIQSHKPIAKE